MLINILGAILPPPRSIHVKSVPLACGNRAEEIAVTAPRTATHVLEALWTWCVFLRSVSNITVRIVSFVIRHEGASLDANANGQLNRTTGN